ncbi:hypothetical protein ACOMHN_026819 [Nucella lapillus]
MMWQSPAPTVQHLMTLFLLLSHAHHVLTVTTSSTSPWVPFERLKNCLTKCEHTRLRCCAEGLKRCTRMFYGTVTLPRFLSRYMSECIFSSGMMSCHHCVEKKRTSCGRTQKNCFVDCWTQTGVCDVTKLLNL